VKIARVIGTVVCSIKHESFVGSKLLLVQPVDGNGRSIDKSLIAVDGAQAGIGDFVLVVQEGRSARQVMQSKNAPCEAVIVGVIDHVVIHGKNKVLSLGTR
jgi:microcompartment protein CcmK/EutM